MALRVFLALGFSLLIAGASRAHAQTSVDDALLLAKRIAGVSVSAQVTFGGLPPKLDANGATARGGSRTRFDCESGSGVRFNLLPPERCTANI
jgi:hypothetical protein